MNNVIREKVGLLSVLSDVSNEYLDRYGNIYKTALSDEYTIEDIIKRVRVIIPEKAENIIIIINQTTNIEAAKEIVIIALKELLIQYVTEQTGLSVDKITPWDLAAHRDEILTRLFNKERNMLNIKVIVGNNSYTHNLSEEFVYGLLTILNNIKEFRIYLDGKSVDFNIFTKKYEGFSGRYSVKVKEVQYEFMTIDFIQGVISGAKWTNQDPYVIITELFERNEGNKIHLNF